MSERMIFSTRMRADSSLPCCEESSQMAQSIEVVLRERPQATEPLPFAAVLQ